MVISIHILNISDSAPLNGQGPCQNPTRFLAANRNDESAQKFGQLHICNSSHAVQTCPEPAMFPNHMGWPGNLCTSWTLNSSLPSGFLEQIQAKNQMLVKNKEVMEK